MKRKNLERLSTGARIALCLIPALVLLTSTGCPAEGEKGKNPHPSAAAPFAMGCVKVGSGSNAIFRCENKEVLCYHVSSHLECQFKGEAGKKAQWPPY